jgi:hypothetical protein
MPNGAEDVAQIIEEDPFYIQRDVRLHNYRIRFQ